MEDVIIPTWPPSLPIAPLLEAYDETHPSLIKSVSTGNKSKIVRKVATRSQVTMRVSFNLSREQVEIFEGFFDETLDGGALRFTFIHPRKKSVIEVSFSPSQQTAYTVKPNGSMNYYKVSSEFLVWN